MIIIERGRKEDAAVIASLVMEAMNHECCQWFAGPRHTLDDFHRLMKGLVEREDTQYSYLNTLAARTEDGSVAGICISYDGALLRPLRRAFIDGALEAFGRDFSDMKDETQPGELYVDSLCVASEFRGQGIATRLLQATIEKGRGMNLPTGLLVDMGNPRAERLYRRIGFRHVNDSEWGGHAMRHLVHPFAPLLPED
ncbi:GNAT family N-acetyltransferase [Prevotella dentasini]|uniref:GNAT family N-acetyltransferase n=1 Tax=Prevotella dentasini TaxID=589537 RepID=UPI00046A1B87|nr:GNAT family N-acetyltransferase [Prevotella dentasini]